MPVPASGGRLSCREVETVVGGALGPTLDLLLPEQVFSDVRFSEQPIRPVRPDKLCAGYPSAGRRRATWGDLSAGMRAIVLTREILAQRGSARQLLAQIFRSTNSRSHELHDATCTPLIAPGEESGRRMTPARKTSRPRESEVRFFAAKVRRVAEQGGR